MPCCHTDARIENSIPAEPGKQKKTAEHAGKQRLKQIACKNKQPPFESQLGHDIGHSRVPGSKPGGAFSCGMSGYRLRRKKTSAQITS